MMTQVGKFNTLASAQSYSARCSKTMFIVLGDDNQYWVATWRYASWLVKNGYEMLEA